jgi:hypothetical protein
VGGDDGARFEQRQDPLPVALGEAAPGDARQLDVAPRSRTASSIRLALPWW